MSQRKTWYLVQCKPRQDERAEEHLMRQGYECSRPKYQSEEGLKAGRKPSSKSLFPGYLFVNLPYDANWASLRSTRGVSRVVGFGGQPLAVSDNLIEELKSRAECSVNAEPKVGDNVQVISGHFANLDAIFLAPNGVERVMLLINLLNRQQEVILPRANIAAI